MTNYYWQSTSTDYMSNYSITGNPFKEQILAILKRRELEITDVGMFCPSCGTGVHKHIFRSDNSAVEISYCPFCGNKLDWGNNDE